MATIFKIPIINPFRFVNAGAYDAIDPRYNTVPFDLTKDGAGNPNGFYLQKWQINDFTKFQFQTDADAESLSFTIYKFNPLTGNIGASVVTPPVVLQTIPIIGVTWSAYEVTIDFEDIPEGFYVGVLEYTDDTDTIQYVQTAPLDLRTQHPGTLLYEYSHTVNDKGIVWATGIIMSFRIEGKIREFDPKAQTDDYVDQKYNTYSLNDIPYRVLNNYIGLARGLPDWAVDKMNVIFTVNTLLIDGTPYAKLSGQVFQMVRPTNGINENGYASIKIIPNENFNLGQYLTGETPSGDYIVIAKQLPYYNNSANIVINGVFKAHTNLIGIAIWNRGADAFTMKIGTTDGGNEIAQFDVTDDVTSFLLINTVFEQPENVFITGLAGTDLDVNVRFDDYDAIPSAPPGTGSGGLIPNVEYTYYEYVVGDFVRDWNVGTGLGNPGTAFEGCALLDGQNGTINDAYLSRIGYDKTEPLLRQTIIGNAGNIRPITINELPTAGLGMFCQTVQFGAPVPPPYIPGTVPAPGQYVSRQRQAGGGLDMEIVSQANPAEIPDTGVTAPMGLGNPLDIQNEALVMAKFIKLPV